MAYRALFSVGIALLLALPVQAKAQAALPCQLCDPATQAASSAASTLPVTPLTVQIEAELAFGVAAIGPNGTGMIAIDPRTDMRVVSGGLIDLGGMAFSGVVRLSGDPLRRIRITLPSVETMNAPGGAQAQITGFATDIPQSAMLDATGNLLVHFAGRFSVMGGATGDFRGRVTVTADYE